MKSFMEEYGKIVVAAIVVMIFAVVASPIGSGLRDGVTKVASTLTTNVKEGFSNAENGAGGSGGSGGSGEEPVTLAAGLYDENDNLLISWEDLTSKDYMTLTNGCCIPEQAILTVDENGVLTSANDQDCCLENYSSSYLNGKLVIPNSVTNISDFVFSDCKGLTFVTIPESVTSISLCAFSNCTNLTSITIPESVTTIGSQAFCNCTNLTSIAIPENVTSIGEAAFNNCESLTSVTIPEGVISIEDSVLGNCTNLTSITIPNSVTSIGENAFRSSTDLTTVNFTGSEEQWNAIEFGERWNWLCPEITVHCTDGDIVIPANN